MAENAALKQLVSEQRAALVQGRQGANVAMPVRWRATAPTRSCFALAPAPRWVSAAVFFAALAFGIAFAMIPPATPTSTSTRVVQTIEALGH
jgi:hypothetical protein